MKFNFRKQDVKQDVRKEIVRRKSQCQRIVDLFERMPNGSVTNIDLAREALNYKARVFELRQDDHLIPKPEYVRPGVFRYFYNGRKKVSA